MCLDYISKRHLRLSVSQTIQCKLINDARKYNLGALELPSLGYAVVFSRECRDPKNALRTKYRIM